MTVHQRRVLSAQHHTPTFEADRIGFDESAVFECSRKNADRVARERAQVARLVAWRLHRQTNAFKPTTRDFNALACRQDGCAAGALNHPGLRHFDIGCNQQHIAVARNDVPLHLQVATGRTAVSTEAQTSCRCICSRHRQRGRGKPSGVHHRPSPDGDA